jgi:hypothetical protein
MVDENDISIGENAWIKWVDFEPGDNEILEIDELLKPTFDFWSALETECVAGCCGIGAFSFWKEGIVRAAADFGNIKLQSHLSDIKEQLIKSGKTTVSSTRLNNLFHKEVFIELLDHILLTTERHKSNPT